MDVLNKSLKEVSKGLSNSGRLFNNAYVSAVVTLFLILYASLARPQLPQFIAQLFDNALFRLLVLFGIAFMASRNIQVALLVAVAFTVTMNLLNQQKTVEGFMEEEYEVDALYD